MKPSDAAGVFRKAVALKTRISMLSEELNSLLESAAVRMSTEIKNCPGCGAQPGEIHSSVGCDIERCSRCGGQKILCRCKGHDPAFSRWTGIFPGAAESAALGIDLNEFHRLDLHRVFFTKPVPNEDRVKVNGLRYEALPVKLGKKKDGFRRCSGCVADGASLEAVNLCRRLPSCTRWKRHDGRDIIWVRIS